MSDFSEMAQALRAAPGGRRAQRRRLVAAVCLLFYVVCVNRAIFNPYDAEAHLRAVREASVM